MASLHYVKGQESSQDERLALLPFPSLARADETHDERPLSDTQERLWLLAQLDPNATVHHISGKLYLTGRLDVACFQRSLDQVAQRHDVLRAIFVPVNGQPVQIISDWALKLQTVDLRNLARSEQETTIRELVRKETRRPFDLARGPLLRTLLFRLGQEEHVLFLTLPPLVGDRRSVQILFQETMAFYISLLSQEPSSLPQLSRQYSDFVHQEQVWLQSEQAAEQRIYWTVRLGGEWPGLELPTDRPRSRAQAWSGSRHNFALPQSLVKSLHTFSRRENVALDTILVAVFKTLLYRYTGETGISVGSTTRSKSWTDVQGLIGPLENYLVLQTDLAGHPTFRQLLERVKKTTAEAFARGDIPFATVLKALQSEPSLDQSPFFQVMFDLETETAPVTPPGSIVCRLEIKGSVSECDLGLFLAHESDRITGTVEYDHDLFDAATIKRLVDHFQTLLLAAITHPDMPLTDLPILTPSELMDLDVWNTTETDFPPDTYIHTLFETQVNHSPDAVALCFKDEQITYHEVNRRANQLAHYLSQLGVGPEMLVVVCIERSPEIVIGLLGILKAGAAYVPLDPAYPRLAFILEDTRATVLLTQQRLVSGLPEYAGRMICLDADWDQIAQGGEDNPARQITGDNLAYAIYTAGSMGQPKGVLICHATIANHCYNVRRRYRITPADRVLQFSTISFDVSLEQIFCTLISGGELVLRDEELWNPASFYERALDLKLTVIDLPPAYWDQVIWEWRNVPEQVSSSSLRLIIIGGDVLPPEGVRLWRKTPLKDVQLVNAYGPTETTITATLFDVSPWLDEAQLLNRIPIGRPLANRKFYVLDRYGHPVPVGVAGELYIGGVGLARGYFNRPELTAATFVPDPFVSPPTSPPLGGTEGGTGARLYKTGDWVRYLPDGNVDFLGRADEQVKIRGLRIELGEIEAALARHQAVKKVFVTPRDDIVGGKQIVAYLVVNQEAVPSAGEMRRFLRQKLPDYMIPAAYVMLDAFPLMPSGKIDRRALPAPERSQVTRERAFVAPRTPFEEILAEIFGEVLELEHPSVHDNFFDLSGHSLLATQVMSRVRDRFEIDLPVRYLFESPTVAQMALRVEQAVIAEIQALDPDEAARLLQS
jgi:amino acid adenylation domain-containing protein